jgi:hypothetical protein
MNGYEVYKMCRTIQGWSTPSLEVYLNGKESPYYEMLVKFFINEKNLSVQHINDYLRAVYNNLQVEFDPYKLMNEEYWEIYETWLKTKSTKELYFQEIRKSFNFIENFCIGKSINLEQYKKAYAYKHIREKKIDYAVAVHLSLIDKDNLKKVERFMLKNFLSQYNIIVRRLSNTELNMLLTELTNGMNKLLNTYQQKV